jgi:hypothetical protein
MTTRNLVAGWAVGAVALTFVEAIARLGDRALATAAAGLAPGEWAALAASVALFGWGEGHRALARRFVPGVVARSFALADRRPGALAILAAPLHALALVGRGAARAWLGVALIVAAVLAVRALPAPWRGIVDGGVAVALVWGLGALLSRFVAELLHDHAQRRRPALVLVRVVEVGGRGGRLVGAGDARHEVQVDVE